MLTTQHGTELPSSLPVYLYGFGYNKVDKCYVTFMSELY